MHTLQLGLTWLSWQFSKLGYSFTNEETEAERKKRKCSSSGNQLDWKSNSFSSHSPSSSSLHCMAAPQLSQIHQKLKVTIYSRVYVNVNISKLCWYEDHVSEVLYQMPLILSSLKGGYFLSLWCSVFVEKFQNLFQWHCWQLCWISSLRFFLHLNTEETLFILRKKDTLN